jgi:hypothetical protein
MPDLVNIVRRRPLVSIAVGGDCHSLGHSVACGPGGASSRLVRGALTVWMQTTGASLFAVYRSSPAHVQMPAQGSRSRMGCCTLLLYRTTATI